ncbi:alpha/beta fold hydrolase [Mobilicoccus massiliensis]|uniref:alpha/beta fold hydrolase n=1 Tax=Mobilicoccus massiliensis TaxID=1522310 RepID=UPI00058D9C28|nr:alpha/beta hydrolase [Mobilicoccus massiliensis]
MTTSPRGVPRLPEVSGRSGVSLGRSALGVGLGLAAAGITAAAGMAADRLSRDRRTAVALDAGVADPRYHETPDSELVVTATDGVELHVEIDEPRREANDDGNDDAATRPTVVLSHGYCLNLTSWVFQRRALREAGYRVVLWDQRGHGLSGMGDRESISIEQLGDDLYRVVEEVVPEGPIVLVGHSMGGMSMMALALEHEDFVKKRVVGAAFVATSPGNLSGVSYGLGRLGGHLVRRLTPWTSSVLAPRQNLVDRGLRQARDVVDFFVDFGSFGSPVPLSIAQLTTDMIFGTRMEVISAFFPLFDQHDKREALAAFDGVETLVISGTADRLTPPEHSEEIVRLIPGAEHVLVEDAGHVIMLEHPEILDEYLLELVARSCRAGDGRRPVRVRRQVKDVAGRRAARRARRPKENRDAASA